MDDVLDERLDEKTTQFENAFDNPDHLSMFGQPDHSAHGEQHGLIDSDGYEIDFENNSQFEQTDYDEEFLIGSFANSTLAGLLSSKSRSAHLHSPTSSITPDFPPPKF